MKTIVVVPAFNEEKTIGGVILGLKKYVQDIIVVDDGSSDQTVRLAGAAGARVISHFLNRGLGGALGTGIQAALNHQADIVVTFDADAQHNPADLSRLIEPIESGEAEVVIGSRMIKSEGMPLIRQAYNRLANLITKLLFGFTTSDSQSGLRALSRRAAKLIRVRTNKMEVSSEIIHEVKHHRLKYLEVPITPIYHQYSLSKGQNFITGIKTFVRLIILRFFKRS
jgi:glycosyltransferase involved in cell wall biosynthesis